MSNTRTLELLDIDNENNNIAQWRSVKGLPGVIIWTRGDKTHSIAAKCSGASTKCSCSNLIGKVRSACARARNFPPPLSCILVNLIGKMSAAIHISVAILFIVWAESYKGDIDDCNALYTWILVAGIGQLMIGAITIMYEVLVFTTRMIGNQFTEFDRRSYVNCRTISYIWYDSLRMVRILRCLYGCCALVYLLAWFSWTIYGCVLFFKGPDALGGFADGSGCGKLHEFGYGWSIVLIIVNLALPCGFLLLAIMCIPACIFCGPWVMYLWMARGVR